MAKTTRRPSDSFERKQRLAQRPQRGQDQFNKRNWLADLVGDEDQGDISETHGAAVDLIAA